MDEEIIKAHGWWILPAAAIGFACCILGVIVLITI